MCFHCGDVYQFVIFGRATYLRGVTERMMPCTIHLATAEVARGVRPRRLRLLLVGLVALVITAVGALPAQAASYSYVSLKAVVKGSTVRATAVVKASRARTVQAYGIVVDKDGPRHHNLVAFSGVRILRSGTSITGTHKYAPGHYRYSIFVRETSRSAWLRVGPEKRFTVGSANKPEPKPKPKPKPTPTPSPSRPPSSSAGHPPVAVGALLFSDDFNGTALDSSKWSQCWWPNAYSAGSDRCGEMNESTTAKSNVDVGGGVVTLTQAGRDSGALIDTDPEQGRRGFQFKEGYAEARVYFPGSGQTVYNWPAWWTVGAPYPAEGENDIAEGLGEMTVNYHGPCSANQGQIPGVWVNGFHTYGLHRYRTASGETRSDVYYDGKLVKSYRVCDGNAPQYLIFNVGTKESRQQVYGKASQVKVDWVRVWARG
jgi:hypothetical protein